MHHSSFRTQFGCVGNLDEVDTWKTEVYSDRDYHSSIHFLRGIMKNKFRGGYSNDMRFTGIGFFSVAPRTVARKAFSH